MVDEVKMRYHQTRFLVLLLIWVLLLLPRPGESAFSGADDESPGSREAELSGLNVALLKSDYTSRYFAEKWQYEEVIYRWLTFLAENGIRHRLVTDAELEAGGAEEFTILILPAALCLSEGELEGVRRFLSGGKGVVASWATGVRSSDGEWRGWGFLEELTGSGFGGYLAGRSAMWVTFSGRTPLSLDLGPGHKLELVAGWKIALDGSPKDAYWSDYNLNPRHTDGAKDADVALAHNASGTGRVAWFAFSTTEVIANAVNQATLKTLMLNAIMWTGRIPVTHVWHWPDGRQAAAVFSQDVEYLFHHGAAAVDVLKAEGVSGTFFCVSDLGAENRELVSAFAQIGEVGSHSDDHSEFEGQPLDAQYRRLKKSAETLAEIAGEEVQGMRPPYELCDEVTLKAWAMQGGRYVFGQPRYEPMMMPQLYTVPRDPSRGLEEDVTLVLLPRAVRDDHGTLVVEKLDANDKIFEAHRLDMERVYGLSGLCMFGYHSNLLCLPERVDVLSRMARYAKGLDLWLATAGEVARWWRVRAGVSAEINRGEDRSLTLSIRNRGTEAVEGLSVVVYLPEKPDQVVISGTLPDQPTPTHSMVGERLIVYVDSVKASALDRYSIQLF